MNHTKEKKYHPQKRKEKKKINKEKKKRIEQNRYTRPIKALYFIKQKKVDNNN